ncbi:hypothetical protein [Hyphomicrobium sp. MC8b]|uniref:hypothetical protein n=1 Tax=Hyphomicrobium sp. MC8b TaxID=300273 RepID=UPI00391A660B
MGLAAGIVAAAAAVSDCTAPALCGVEFDFFVAATFFLEDTFLASGAFSASTVICGIGIGSAAGACVKSCGGS